MIAVSSGASETSARCRSTFEPTRSIVSASRTSKGSSTNRPATVGASSGGRSRPGASSRRASSSAAASIRTGISEYDFAASAAAIFSAIRLS